MARALSPSFLHFYRNHNNRSTVKTKANLCYFSSQFRCYATITPFQIHCVSFNRSTAQATHSTQREIAPFASFQRVLIIRECVLCTLFMYCFFRHILCLLNHLKTKQATDERNKSNHVAKDGHTQRKIGAV